MRAPRCTVRVMVLAALLLAAGLGSAAGAAAPATRASLPPTLGTWDFNYVGSWAKSVVVGDFTGDGRQDVVMGTGWYYSPDNDNKLFLFRQATTGALHPPVRLATDGDGIDDDMAPAAGDVDGDGKTDLVLATLKGIDVFLQRNGGLSLDRLIELPGARQVSLVDLDTNGHLDLVVNTNGGLVTLLGTGAGAFGPPTAVNASRYVEIETGDVTGDSRVDIVGLRENNVEVLARRADGTFAEPVLHHVHDYANMSRGLALGDLNGDGRNDVAVSIGVNKPGSMIDVFMQTAGGTLGPPAALPSYDIPQALVAADMNMDGRTDLVTVHGGWNRAGIYTQGPDGTMGPEELFAMPYASHYPPKGLAIGDFSGDGSPDLAAADYNNGLVVLRSSTQLRAWGLGNFGQLGNASTASSATPTAPMSLTGVGAATAGAYHTAQCSGPCHQGQSSDPGRHTGKRSMTLS
ncbi:MAG: FG-GAP-like repeat-containing protein [Acidimicrobiales bacterium]